MKNSHVEATIPVSSIDTFHEGLNGKLQAKEFFNAEQYPAILFKSTDIRKTSRETARMTGDLTIRGVTRPVTLDVDFNSKRFHDRFKLNLVGFSATGSLDRRDFGLGFLPITMVGGTIEFRIEMSAFEGQIVPLLYE